MVPVIQGERCNLGVIVCMFVPVQEVHVVHHIICIRVLQTEALGGGIPVTPQIVGILDTNNVLRTFGHPSRIGGASFCMQQTK